jgi:hypothetical protein
VEVIIITDPTHDPTEISFDAILADEPIANESPKIGKDPLIGEWASFWLKVWLGTALSGGAFGALAVIVNIAFHLLFDWTVFPQAIFAIGLAVAVGTLWAGIVGVLVVPTVALLAWSFFCLDYPKTIGAIAGALTGAASVSFYPPVLIFTAVAGAIGGAIAAGKFWNSPDSLILRRAQEACRVTGIRFHFTIRDLLLRTTAAALLLTVWMFIFRLFYHS